MADGRVIIESLMDNTGLDKGLGELQTKLGNVGSKMGNMGKTLTKRITVPIVGAATAAGGLVATLGFQRLTGIDNAKAKLEGMGYSGQDIDRIMDDLSVTLADGMTTMAEGVDIAAGAMAAGVSEGEELDRYVRLVGDAAVGANRDVGEMAQIFNRVQGSGKLMTQELNQIEHGMPGFSAAMAEHLGVPVDEMREMVTAGEVTSADFLDVMDGFSGGMAEAFAGTFSGMWANAKAYIAIIGEALLGGLFEDIKSGMSSVIEVLSSEEMYAKAEAIGEKIQEAGRMVVDAVRGMIDWWNNLSPAMQDILVKAGLLAVAAGPILSVGAALITVVTSIVGKVIAVGTAIWKVISIVGGLVSFLSGPVVVAIAAVVAAGVLIYKNWEQIKEFGISMWEGIKEAWNTAVEFLLELWEPFGEFFSELWESIKEIAMQVWEPIQELWSEVVEYFSELWSEIVEYFSELWEEIKEVAMTIWEPIVELWNEIVEKVQELWEPVAEFFSELWDSIKDITSTAWEGIKSVIESVTNIIKGIVEKVWGAIKTLTSSIWESISGFISTTWENIKVAIDTVLTVIKTIIDTAWNTIKGIIDAVMALIQGDIEGAWDAIKGIIDGVMQGIRTIIETIWDGISTIVSNIVGNIRDTVRDIFDSLSEIVSGAMSSVRNAVRTGMGNALSAVTDRISDFANAGRNIVTSIADGIKGAMSKVTDAMSNVAQKARDMLPFSPAKEGPLKDLDKLDFGGPIQDSINKAIPNVHAEMEHLLHLKTLGLTASRGNLKGTSAMNNSNMLRDLETAIARGMANAKGNHEEIGIVVQIGERTILDTVTNGINRENRINGKTIIKV